MRREATLPGGGPSGVSDQVRDDRFLQGFSALLTFWARSFFAVQDGLHIVGCLAEAMAPAPKIICPRREDQVLLYVPWSIAGEQGVG